MASISLFKPHSPEREEQELRRRITSRCSAFLLEFNKLNALRTISQHISTITYLQIILGQVQQSGPSLDWQAQKFLRERNISDSEKIINC